MTTKLKLSVVVTLAFVTLSACGVDVAAQRVSIEGTTGQIGWSIGTYR